MMSAVLPRWHFMPSDFGVMMRIVLSDFSVGMAVGHVTLALANRHRRRFGKRRVRHFSSPNLVACTCLALATLASTYAVTHTSEATGLSEQYWRLRRLSAEALLAIGTSDACLQQDRVAALLVLPDVTADTNADGVLATLDRLVDTHSSTSTLSRAARSARARISALREFGFDAPAHWPWTQNTVKESEYLALTLSLSGGKQG
jgi:hypothetical protein